MKKWHVLTIVILLTMVSITTHLYFYMDEVIRGYFIP